MVDNIFRRAKAFIGLEESEMAGEIESNIIPTPKNSTRGKQLDISSILRAKKDKDRGEDGLSIMFYEPKVYEESLSISGHLRNGSPVIINLKYLESNEGTRLIDFVCGTCFAIDGHMLKIGESIFLFVPRGINISDNSSEKNAVEEEVIITSIDEPKRSFFNR